jgi:biotin carboxyl carrier protein
MNRCELHEFMTNDTKSRMRGTHYPFLGALLLLLTCCGGNSGKVEETTERVTTPVTVMTVIHRPISEIISFKGVSAYQKKNQVRSNVNGYIVKTLVNIGDYVNQGKPIFTATTKEAKALGSALKNDSLFTFKGEMTINAPSSGVVTEVNKQSNDYVSDGDQLCVIAEQNSFVFLLNVPFEQNRYTPIGKECKIVLPDSTLINAVISSKLAAVDPVAQTQSYVVKPQTKLQLPENLSAVVKIVISTKQNAQALNRSCVLSDETMENFWIMKLINDSTAVKVPVQQATEADSVIEIVSPLFSPADRIIKTGNYGLPDTATVKVINVQ